MCDQFVIENPKRRPSTTVGRDEWFPYYAGFSSEFARKIISSSGLDQQSTFLDPWNGGGTSTSAAALYGHHTIGFDLNPVMVVVAKARLLPGIELPSVAPLLVQIVKRASDSDSPSYEEDPLNTWFMPSASKEIRSIDRAIRVLLICASSSETSVQLVSRMSAMASFFYVALFRTVRQLLARFQASNPTWIRRPATPRSRIRPATEEIRSVFEQHVSAMSSDIRTESRRLPAANDDCCIEVASSEKLPVRTNSVDLVLSSPPYCTRIDYGVATSPELAVLGVGMGKTLHELRNALIGTPTIQGVPRGPNPNWGPTCNAFLGQVVRHPSKAAESYYYKTYTQYFSAIAKSFSEIARCVKPRGNCVIVVQDSYFKGIRADLATIFTEIASTNQLSLSRQIDFPMSRTLAQINTNSRRYRSSSRPIESVLCYTKN